MLTSVACVGRANAQLEPLDHATSLISELLDRSVTFSLADAAANGSTSLFQRVLTRALQVSDVDPLLRDHWLGIGMAKAIEHGHLTIVKFIHDAHPAPLSVQSFKVAAEFGRLEILQWLHEHRCDRLCIDVPPAQRTPQSMRCCLATQCEMPALLNRHIRVLRWLYETGYIDWLRGAGDIAATQGDLEMVQWLHEHAIDGAFTATAIDAAATHGRLDVLQFLHEHGYQGGSPGGFMQAIARGHTDVVQYLHLQRICTNVVLEELIVLAAEHGRVSELERFKSSVVDQHTRENLMNVAVAHGQLQVAQWLGVGNCRVRATSLHFAARRGHLSMLQWLHDCDCGQWDAWVVGSAATGGHLDVLQWLYQHRRNLFADSGALRAAVDSRALSIVQWLHARGHDQCSRYVHIAVANGDLPMAKWLHDHREQGSYVFMRNEAESLVTAAQCGHLEMLMWLHENGCDGLTRETTIETPPNVQMWLHTVLGFPITEQIVARAASQGDLVFLQWLYERSNWRAASSSHCHLDHWIRNA